MKPAAPEKTCLHLVVQSSPRAIDNCLAQLDQGDTVLFLDDGVMHLFGDHRRSFRHLSARWCFSAVDLEARGLSRFAQAAGAVTLTDSKIAGLLLDHDFCLTWK